MKLFTGLPQLLRLGCVQLHLHSLIYLNNVMFSQTTDYANLTFNFIHALNIYNGEVFLPLQSTSLVVMYRVNLMSCTVCSLLFKTYIQCQALLSMSLLTNQRPPSSRGLHVAVDCLSQR